MCMWTHTTTPNLFWWIFICSDNIPLNSFIFQYNDSYKSVMSVISVQTLRKPNENLENWMGKERFNPINIQGILWYKQDGFILFHMLSFSSGQNSRHTPPSLFS